MTLTFFHCAIVKKSDHVEDICNSHFMNSYGTSLPLDKLNDANNNFIAKGAITSVIIIIIQVKIKKNLFLLSTAPLSRHCGEACSSHD